MWVPDGTESSYLAKGDYSLESTYRPNGHPDRAMYSGLAVGTMPGAGHMEPIDTGVGRAGSAAVAAGPAVPPLPVGSPLGHPDRPMYTNGAAETGSIEAGYTPPSAWSSWAPVFGELSPQQQYSAMMTAAMPNYAQPYYQQMASRQFDPTFGRFLLGGYGDQSTGLGTGSQFANWYGGLRSGDEMGQAMSQTPGSLNTGWELAKQFGSGTPGGVGWEELAGANPGMAYAMQDPAAIQAMAQAKYYGGGGPTGGNAGRAVASTLGNIFNRWQAGQLKEGVTAPGGFIPYLGTLSNKWV